MGMAFKSISDYDANPLFQTLVADGVTTDSVFAFKLTENDGSSLYIGGVDTTQYTGDISYADVTEEVRLQTNIYTMVFDTHNSTGLLASGHGRSQCSGHASTQYHVVYNRHGNHSRTFLSSLLPRQSKHILPS